MSTLRPSSCRRDYDNFDFYGLEESAVDSDDEDMSSVTTEVRTLSKGVHKATEMN